MAGFNPIRIDVTGVQSVQQKLEELADRAPDATERGLDRAATRLQNNVKTKLSRRGGARTGRVYEHHFYTDSEGRLRKVAKRDKPHQASAEGEPPAPDTGQLMGSIKIEKVGRHNRKVGTNLHYGRLLEEGTPDMEPRPWLQPAFEESKDEIKNAVVDELRAAGLL